jgi:hypothetical protein
MKPEHHLAQYVHDQNGELYLEYDQLPPLRELIRRTARIVRVRRHEKDYTHILSPIEEAIRARFHADRSFTCHDAKSALKALRDRFPNPPMGGLAAAIYQRLHIAAALSPEDISNAEILACIDRVIDSITSRWPNVLTRR